MSWKLGLKRPLKNQDVFWTITLWGHGCWKEAWIKERQEDPGSAPGKAVAHILGRAQLLPSCPPGKSRFLQPPGSTELLMPSDGF